MEGDAARLAAEKFAARDLYLETERLYGWAPTTTKAILTRLVAKGYLSTTLVGNGFLYRTPRSAIKTLMDAADELLWQFLEGTSGPVLAYLVRRNKLSPEELSWLKALIAEMRPGDMLHSSIEFLVLITILLAIWLPLR